MDSKFVKDQLIDVLKQIQALSGEDCPEIAGTTRPVESLPKFTSKIWPVAAGLLGLALGKSIPCEANIFVDEDSKSPLTIDQTVALVVKIIEEQEVEEVEA